MLALLGTYPIALLGAPSALADVSVEPAGTYVTNGSVGAAATDQTTTYIGGDSTQVGPRTGPGDGIDVTGGTSIGLSAPAAAASDAGALDRSFGQGGRVTTPFDAFVWNSMLAGTGLIQPDGKLVAVGVGAGTELALNPPSFLVARYNPNGAPDSSFGTAGIVTTNLHGSVYGATAALQSDGKIVVAGTLGSGVVIVRYNQDGSLDSSFGAGGTVTLSCCTRAVVAIQPDGKVVLASTSSLARLNPDGSLDSSFGNEGFATAGAVVNAVLLQPDGRIVTTGVKLESGSPPNVELTTARYLRDGSLDNSFGSGGQVTTAVGSGFFPGPAYASRQADGKIVVATRGEGGATILRYNPNGSLDASFGDAGVEVAQLGDTFDPVSLTLQPDGRILVADPPDTFGFRNDIKVARFDADGSIDTSFASGGVATATFEADSVGVAAVVVDSSGRIAAIGDAYRLECDDGSCFPGGPVDFAVARFTQSGTLDPSFGSAGTVTTSPGKESVPGLAGADAVMVQPSHKLIAVGSSKAPNGDPDIAIAHYDPAGALDPSFGDGGQRLTGQAADGASFSVAFVAAFSEGGGKVLVVGNASAANPLRSVGSSRLSLTQYGADGSLDPGFGDHGQVVADSLVAEAAARQPDGKTIVVGRPPHDHPVVARFQRDGRLDTSFGTGGIVRIQAHVLARPKGVIVEPRGRIVVASDRALVGITSSGAIDRRFGRQGLVRVFRTQDSLSSVKSMSETHGGEILLAASLKSRLGLLRYRANGVADRSFGGNGTVVTRLTGSDRPAVASGPNGRVIIGTTFASTGQIGLLRLLRDGSRDRSFGHRGIERSGLRGLVNAVTLAPNHRILIAGESPNSVFLLARFDG